MGGALAIPGTKVDRTSFLYNQLSPYCHCEQVQQAIESRPALAGVSPRVINRLADACIRTHVTRAAGISFAAGVPGGWWIAGTLPADLVAFFREAIILAQKLAYLYGWPDLLENGEVDEQTKYLLTLLIGSMLGAQSANRMLAEIARRFAQQVIKRLPRQALTRYAIYNIVKQVARWIGVRITKTTFARGASKVIPLVGGALSAGVTVVLFRPMAKRLKNHLKTTRYAHPDRGMSKW